MPIYEYQCTKCDTHFERRQGISEEPLKICDVCGGGLEKKWSLSGFQFRGEGWYVTDYAGKKGGNNGNAEGKEKKPEKESTASTETASNNKVDTPATSKTD